MIAGAIFPSWAACHQPPTGSSAGGQLGWEAKLPACTLGSGCTIYAIIYRSHLMLVVFFDVDKTLELVGPWTLLGLVSAASVTLEQIFSVGP